MYTLSVYGGAAAAKRYVHATSVDFITKKKPSWRQQSMIRERTI